MVEQTGGIWAEWKKINQLLFMSFMISDNFIYLFKKEQFNKSP